MAVDGYMYFQDYSGQYLRSESQVDLSKGSNEPLFKQFKLDKVWGGPLTEGTGGCGLFEIDDFSFGIEQVLNIGSQSTGAGAGKVTFNPFSITRKIDRSSPKLFENACSGTPFKEVGLAMRKGGGGAMSGKVFLVFRFKLVAVKTINWSNEDESPKETIEFEYGGLQVHYSPQNPDGNMTAVIPGGWNRVRNVQDVLETPIQ